MTTMPTATKRQQTIDNQVETTRRNIEKMQQALEARRNCLVNTNWLIQFPCGAGGPTYLKVYTDDQGKVTNCHGVFSPLQASQLTERDAKKLAADSINGADVVGEPVLFTDALREEIARAEASIPEFLEWVEDMGKEEIAVHLTRGQYAQWQELLDYGKSYLDLTADGSKEDQARQAAAEASLEPIAVKEAATVYYQWREKVTGEDGVERLAAPSADIYELQVTFDPIWDSPEAAVQGLVDLAVDPEEAADWVLVEVTERVIKRPEAGATDQKTEAA